MKVIRKLQKFFGRDKSDQTEKIILTEKQCPHCVSRGMFIFNDD